MRKALVIIILGWIWWCFTRRKIKNIKISINPLPLHFIPKSRKLDMLESVEIKKALHYKHNILNNQLDIKNSPIIDILINDI